MAFSERSYDSASKVIDRNAFVILDFINQVYVYLLRLHISFSSLCILDFYLSEYLFDFFIVRLNLALFFTLLLHKFAYTFPIGHTFGFKLSMLLTVLFYRIYFC